MMNDGLIGRLDGSFQNILTRYVDIIVRYYMTRCLIFGVYLHVLQVLCQTTLNPHAILALKWRPLAVDYVKTRRPVELDLGSS